MAKIVLACDNDCFPISYDIAKELEIIEKNGIKPKQTIFLKAEVSSEAFEKVKERLQGIKEPITDNFKEEVL
jgi:hypothetical protein